MNLPSVYIRHRELQPAGTGKISHSMSACSFPLSLLLVSCPCLEFSFNQFFGVTIIFPSFHVIFSRAL